MNFFIQNKNYLFIKIHYGFLTVLLFLCYTLNAQNSVETAKNGDPYKIADSYYNAGNSLYLSNKMDSALYYYEQSLIALNRAEKKEKEDKSEYLKILLFNSIGTIKNVCGIYDSALDNFLKALALAEKINRQDAIAASYLNMANAYMRMSNLTQAEAYYLKGENLFRVLNDSTGLTDACLGLVGVFIDRENYSKALVYADEVERIMSALPDVADENMMFLNQQLTDLWLKIPDYNKALEYAKKTVEYAQQTGFPPYTATALYLLSTCYLKQGKYLESEKTAFQALAADTTDTYVNSVLYGNIAQANIWLGDRAKSIEYFSKTLNANRAYSSKNFQSSISEMEVKHETEKKEFKIAALEEEKRLMQWLSISGGIVLFLTLMAFFFLWRWTVQKRRIAEQQRQLAEQQVKQLEQEKRLVATQAVLDGETQERARLARDLHDGLGSMLTGVKLSLLEMKKGVVLEYKEVERFDRALGLLDDSVHEMRRVAHHLMPDSLSRFGLKPAVSDFCSNLPSVSFAYYGDESRLDPKLEVMIYRSIHELVNNALKHAGAGKIMVQIMQEPDRIAFNVQDDGCGFNPSMITEGTGLQNIRARIASYNGVINVDSKIGEGTEVNVELGIEN